MNRETPVCGGPLCCPARSVRLRLRSNEAIVLLSECMMPPGETPPPPVAPPNPNHTPAPGKSSPWQSGGG